MLPGGVVVDAGLGYRALRFSWCLRDVPPNRCSLVLLRLHCACVAVPRVQNASSTPYGSLCGLATWAGRPTEAPAVQLGRVGPVPAFADRVP